MNRQEYQFPYSESPRVWLITSAATPLALGLIKALLSHGDHVVAGLTPLELHSDSECCAELLLLLRSSSEAKGIAEVPGKLKVVELDSRFVSKCQSAIAKVLETWGKIDVLLCCTSQALVGTIEELAVNEKTHSLIAEQFDVNYFGMVNIITTAIPVLRAQANGHVIVLTGDSGHIGTPGLGIYCASSWALEGFCDSLTFEVAPFNVKVSIVQPNLEVSVLTNRISFAPAMLEYSGEDDSRPNIRKILTDTIKRGAPESPKQFPSLSPEIQTFSSPISAAMAESLVEETVYTLTSIGGHSNPPARHIVGREGVTAVKEKLKTVSEELEDFAEVGLAIDIHYEVNSHLDD